MELGILFDASRVNGGSYQMSINNIKSLVNNLKKNKIKYFVFTHQNNPNLDFLKIKYKIIKISKMDFLYLFLSRLKIFKKILNKLNISSQFENNLLNNNINLLIFFFTSWKSLLLRKIKYTSTVLDTCHLDYKGGKKFKEVNTIVYYVREYLNKKVLPKACKIIIESEFLKKKIIKKYKLKPNSIISIPNVPSILLKQKKRKEKKLSKFKNYYFYPAQFWQHKNHIIILKVVKKLKMLGKNINFVFCGKDKGNLMYIKKKISDFNIKNNIQIFNYVSENNLLKLYTHCKALVMPTFFGPTNIPPVEAWALGVPVAYSSVNRDHGGDAALYFNPDSEDQLTQVIFQLDSLNTKKMLISKGKKRFKHLNLENKIKHKLFVSEIKKLNL